MRGRNLATGAAAAALAVGAYAVGVNQSAPPATAQNGTQVNLWKTYTDVLTKARYISLNHVLTPTQPVWKGFGPSTFSPTVDPATKQPYTYAKDGFEATHYDISTDQFGTQLDPPAHWAPEYPGIDELPGDVRRPAAGRDLDRRPGQEEGRLPPAGLRHREVGEGARPRCLRARS